MKFDIRPVTKEQIDQVVELMNLAFSDEGGTHATYDTMYNKYFGSPLQLNNAMLGAFCDDKLIAYSGFMLTKYRYRGNYLTGMQICDSVAHPDYQRMGAYSKILKASFELAQQEGADFVFGFPNPKSRPALEKIGMTTVAHGKYIHYPLSICKVAAERFNKKLPKFFDKLFGIYQIPQKYRAKRFKSFTITKTDAVTEEFCSKPQSDYIFMDMSMEWLNWRLKGKRFSFYVVKDGEELVARFVIKNMGTIAMLVSYDYFTVNEKKQVSALAMLAMDLKKLGWGILSIWATMDTMDWRIGKQAGFMTYDKYPDGLLTIIQPATNDTSKLDILQNSALWKAQRIDLDTIIDNYVADEHTERHFF